MDFCVRDAYRFASILALSGVLTGCSVYDDDLLQLASSPARDAGSFEPPHSNEAAAVHSMRPVMETCAFQEPGLSAVVGCGLDDAGSSHEPVASDGVAVVSD